MDIQSTNIDKIECNMLGSEVSELQNKIYNWIRIS